MSVSSSPSRADLFRAQLAAAAAAAFGTAAGGLAFAGLAVPAGVAGILAAVAGVAAVLGMRGVAAEIRRGRAVLDRLSRGDFDARVVGIGRGEVAALLDAINAFADRTDAFVRESRASLSAVSEHRYHRRIVERGLLGDFLGAARAINAASGGMAGRIEAFRSVTATFEATVGRVAGTVADASGQLAATAGQMSAVAEGTSHDAVAVSAAVEQVSASVQTVAAAAAELSSSICEITSQVNRSGELARAAAGRAEVADAGIRRLAEAAQRIGEVVGLIRTVAAQTNLLALNATIEAARAGEAGKGFSVVANEVKLLAGQTARATEEIVAQVEAVRSATDGAVGVIRDIREAVGEVNEAMVVVSAAVEQQDAATAEIARNVAQVAEGAHEVSERIAGVTRDAGETGQASGRVRGAAGALSGESQRLEAEIATFLAELGKVV